MFFNAYLYYNTFFKQSKTNASILLKNKYDKQQLLFGYF